MQIYESYICDFCKQEFEDRDVCERHEYFCEIKALEKEKNSKIRMYNKNGNQLVLNENFNIDEVEAIYVSDIDAIRMVERLYDYEGYCHPWDMTWRKNVIEEKPGLVVYDYNSELWYYPEDRVKEIEEILKKFADRG